MKNKFIGILLTTTMMLLLCSCGASKDIETEKNTTEINTEFEVTGSEIVSEDTKKYNLGDTVSTDIMDFTLHDASFSYYLSMEYSTYCEPQDSEDVSYVANKGHTFLPLIFEIENKDRASWRVGELSKSSGWELNWEMLYNNEEYDLKDYNLNSIDGSNHFTLDFSAIGSNMENLKRYDSIIYILSAGEKIVVRTMGYVNMEPANLTDSYELTINVPNSSGEYEEFTYIVK